LLAWSSHHAERFADNCTVQAKVPQGTPISRSSTTRLPPRRPKVPGTVEVFAANNPR